MAESAKGVFPPVGEITDRLCKEFDEADRLKEQSERSVERAKTRFLGFLFSDVSNSEHAEEGEWASELSDSELRFERLVIVEGPGRGRSFVLKGDFFRIGREDGQELQLIFGDSSVSRKTHATLVRSGIHGRFLIRDGRKPNPVLLNGRPFESEEILNNGDLVRVGETTLRFLAGN